MSDIVDRLKDNDRFENPDVSWWDRSDAADEILALREQLAFAMAHPTEAERALREQVAALIEERHKSAEQYVNRLNQIDAMTDRITIEKADKEAWFNQCNALTEDYDMLREKYDALMLERNALRNDRDSQQRVCMAAQAREAKLREALEEANALNINWSSEAAPEVLAYYSEYRKVIAMGKEALAIPTDDSALKERLAQERERCASAIEFFGAATNNNYGSECADAIRSMK